MLSEEKSTVILIFSLYTLDLDICFPLESFKIFLSVLGFLRFEYNMPRCSFLKYISCFVFFELCFGICHYFWKVLRHYHFKYSTLFSLLLLVFQLRIYYTF